MRQVLLPNGLEILAPSQMEAAIVFREIVTERTYRTTCARDDWALHELLGIYTLYASRADAR